MISAPVDEGENLGTAQEFDVIGRAVFERRKIVALQQVQDLDHLGPAARQGVRQHLVPAVRAPHRVVDVGCVRLEVLQRDEAPVPF